MAEKENRPMRVYTKDCLTTGHLEKALTTVHLEQQLSEMVIQSQTTESTVSVESPAPRIRATPKRNNNVPDPDFISYATLIVSVAAFAVALYAIWRANNTASASTYVALNEALREAWSRFFKAQKEEKEAALADLLNLFEIACAIRLEGSLSGNSGILISQYLNDILRKLVTNPYTRENVKPLLVDRGTFCFVKRYLNEKRYPLQHHRSSRMV